MNKEFKNEYWYKELDSHIKCAHASSGNRKTILINREKPFLYLVVTRVNYLTTKLWIEHINSFIKGLDANKFAETCKECKSNKRAYNKTSSGKRKRQSVK